MSRRTSFVDRFKRRAASGARSARSAIRRRLLRRTPVYGEAPRSGLQRGGRASASRSRPTLPAALRARLAVVSCPASAGTPLVNWSPWAIPIRRREAHRRAMKSAVVAETPHAPSSGQAAVWVRVGAGAALLGGGLWIAKGASILVAGYQPPLMFEVGSFAFPVALMGLDALLRKREPGLSRAGGIAAAVAVAIGLALTALLAVVHNPADVVTSL